jgi:hypothetical protein
VARYPRILTESRNEIAGAMSIETFDGFVISMSTIPRNPEILVIAPEGKGEDMGPFTLSEQGLKAAFLAIDKRRLEIYDLIWDKGENDVD